MQPFYGISILIGMFSTLVLALTLSDNSFIFPPLGSQFILSIFDLFRVCFNRIGAFFFGQRTLTFHILFTKYSFLLPC